MTLPTQALMTAALVKLDPASPAVRAASLLAQAKTEARAGGVWGFYGEIAETVLGRPSAPLAALGEAIGESQQLCAVGSGRGGTRRI